jgi:hypothetical protein
MMVNKKRPKFITPIDPGFSGPSSRSPDVDYRPRKSNGKGASLDPQAPPSKAADDDPFLPPESKLTIRRARYMMARMAGLNKSSAAQITDGEPLPQPALQARADQLERVTQEDMRALREQVGMICRELLVDGLDLKVISATGLTTMLEVALNRKAPYRDRLGAAKELAVIGGLYTAPKDEKEAPQESEALRAEIAAKLRGLFGDAKFAPEITQVKEQHVAPPEATMPWD